MLHFTKGAGNQRWILLHVGFKTAYDQPLLASRQVFLPEWQERQHEIDCSCFSSKLATHRQVNRGRFAKVPLEEIPGRSRLNSVCHSLQTFRLLVFVSMPEDAA